MTAHIHAENMKLYAQDAAETAEPWLLWEVRCGQDYWMQLNANPDWSIHVIYRRKPRTHKVNGFEVPEPMRDAPSKDCGYWLASPAARNWAARLNWDGSEDELAWLERGLVFRPNEKEAAIANAKAMIGEQP